MNTLLIAGTDTGVGKTVLAMALAAYWRAYCPDRSLGMIKPIQTGQDNLAPKRLNEQELYPHLVLPSQTPEEIVPFSFALPLDPALAAAQEGRKIKLGVIWAIVETLTQQRDMVLIEAPGGLGAPISRETTVADLAWDWRLPTVLVVPVVRGAIAQTIANVALAQQARMHLKGIILNCIQPCDEADIANWTPVELIQSLTHKPILGLIPHLVDPTDHSKLTQVASNLELERMLPIL